LRFLAELVQEKVAAVAETLLVVHSLEDRGQAPRAGPDPITAWRPPPPSSW